VHKKSLVSSICHSVFNFLGLQRRR